MEYSVETAIAIIVDGNVNLKIDTQHLIELSIRIGSIYQFIGELLVQSDNEVKYHLIRTTFFFVTPFTHKSLK